MVNDKVVRLCSVLGIHHPIIGAPMAGVAGGRLAAAVTAAGGLGLIGAGYSDKEKIQKDFDDAGGARIGIGFITWYAMSHPEQMERALRCGPAVVMLSFGDAREYAQRVRAAGLPFIMQVQNLRMAQAAAQLKPDVIVAQGNDGGGHGAEFRGTLSLVPAVVDAVGPIPVVAAGGIADGRGVAAALMLGASGVLIGTRLLASQESLAPDAAKAAVVHGCADDTQRTDLFDIVRGYPWPKEFTGRALRNEFMKHWGGKAGALRDALKIETPKYWEASRAGDTRTAVTWASQGIDLIHAVQPVQSIVSEMMKTASDALGYSI